ncbi:MAG: asparaginase, partial [Pseudomonadota bacterium]|nr:asparaginase [Pseudomonadota bacterium]
SVAFAGEYWPAQTVQKIHTQEQAAFTGHPRAGYPANSYHRLTITQREYWLEQAQQRLEQAQNRLSQQRICVYYAAPQPIEQIIEQLNDLIQHQPDGVILLGYGLGNLPDHPKIRQLLESAQQSGCLIVLATQVPFGGTEVRYASGDWLAALGVLPSARLTLPAIYARLLWICTTQSSTDQRRRRWLHCLNDTRTHKR